MTDARPLAAVRDGAVVVLAGVGTAFALVGLASAAYRPRGHVGSALDWLRMAVYAVAMAVGAPLRLRSPGNHGLLRLVPLTVTLVLLLVAYRLVSRSIARLVVSAVTAGAVLAVLAALSGSRLRSYGNPTTVRYSVSPVESGLLLAVLVVLAALAAGASWQGAWGRAAAGALRSTLVVATVGAIGAVGVDLARFRSTWGLAPLLLGDGAAWVGGFTLGGQLEADLSSPIPFLSGHLGAGLVTGGAWPVAYALVLVPFVGAVASGRRQRPDPSRPWPEFARAVVVNALLWLVLVEASRLRFSGRLGEDVLSGSAGLDPASTVFLAALWGGVSSVAGLALPRVHSGPRAVED